MNGLEERLRADLQEATDPIRLAPDLDAIVHDGDRVIRSRRVKGAIAGVIGTAVVAALGYPVLASQGLGGGPQPLGTIAATPSTSPAPPLATKAEATIALPTDGSETAVYGVTFTVTRESDGLAVKALAMSKANSVTLGVPAGEWRPGGFEHKGVWVGVLDDRADWFTAAGAGGVHDFTAYTADLPGLNATAYVVVPSKQVRLSSLREVAWRGSDGTIRGAMAQGRDQGTVDVPSTRFEAHGRVGTLAVVGHLLVLIDYDGLGYTMDLREAEGSCRFAGVGEKASTGEAWTSLAICPLPPGAVDVRVSVPEGRTQQQAWFSGREVLVVAGDADSLSGLITSVTFTDASGKSVTARF